MLDASGLASAAAKRRKASAPRKSALPCSDKARPLVGMRLSALRSLYALAHDLFRKPVSTFRDHARCRKRFKKILWWLRGGEQASGAQERRENSSVFPLILSPLPTGETGL
jgi:hypothetical protein